MLISLDYSITAELLWMAVSAEAAETSRLDAEAIQGVLKGDAYRFEELVERYQHRIVGLIGRQVGDRDIAEDLAQDVFVKAYRSLKSFKGESQFITWLTRIALNVVSSYFVSKKYKQLKKSESFDQTKHEPQESQDLTAEEEVMEEMKEALRSAMQELKPTFREVLTLCSIEGKPYEEAASLLNIPVGTVRSRLNKARLLLRQQLGLEVSK